MWNFNCNDVFIYMRTALICLLFFLTGCISGKYTNRTYSFSSGFTWESLTLRADSSFNWSEGSCTHFAEVGGSYRIQGRTLIFLTDSIKPVLVQDIIHHTTPTGDSGRLEFTVLAQYDSAKVLPLPFALVILYSEKDTAWQKGDLTNIDGKVSLTIHKKYFPIKAKIRYVGYSTKHFIFETPVNTSDSIYLEKSFNRLVFLYPVFPQEYRIIQMNSRKVNLVRTTSGETVVDEYLHPKQIILPRRKDTNEQ
jgi:hypothetical protein